MIEISGPPQPPPGSRPNREIWRLRRYLDQPLPQPKLPAGLRLTRWQAYGSRQTHDLLEVAYRAGGGSVDRYDDWVEWFTTDPEFDADSCFLAWQADVLVGAALCWSSAFVKDLCVSPQYRRCGLGSSLLSVVLCHFRERGVPFVELRSHSDNPSGANELYRKMGFVKLET
jgi:ribosomal protein S18 acetylase RimI-like enzyme